YLHEITESIRRYGLEDAVEFLGKKTTEELVQLYQECAIFVFPSTVETFGNPLVEAMACGTPIASSNSSVMPEILGDAAEFFEPLDPQDIASAVGNLLRDQEQQEVLVSNALQRAKHFSWEDTAQKTVEIILGVSPKRSETSQKNAIKKFP
ncbi:MAG: glycosyltransferase, partial [Pseudomonadota bacterium]|nr:glycosyltransferase [Pseudomonadota bacterium]